MFKPDLFGQLFHGSALIPREHHHVGYAELLEVCDRVPALLSRRIADCHDAERLSFCAEHNCGLPFARELFKPLADIAAAEVSFL